jgi:hypothetical protein
MILETRITRLENGRKSRSGYVMRGSRRLMSWLLLQRAQAEAPILDSTGNFTP